MMRRGAGGNRGDEDREALIQQQAMAEATTPALKSIWECNELDNFLSVADAREKGYEAERNTKVVFTDRKKYNTNAGGPLVRVRRAAGAISEEDWAKLHAQLTIPKRQVWSYEMSAGQVQQAEKEAFVDWRRSLAALEEVQDVMLVPFERNLEVWRQLWRVVERAEVVLEILDARNPLVYRCHDFEKYVTSTINPLNNKPKKLILLLNKADFLSDSQRKAWAAHFEAAGDTFFFFSAKPAEADAVMEATVPFSNGEGESDEEENDGSSSDGDDAASPEPAKKTRHKKKHIRAPVNVSSNPYALADQRKKLQELRNQPRERVVKPLTSEEIARDERIQSVDRMPSWAVLSPMQLIDALALLRADCGIEDPDTPLMAGLVGYPNVGKSSTINALIGAKKVVVSATPGKTKHFQTLPIPEERRVGLCDCPGLVFPSFATTREAMLCDGILPVDHSTDASPAIAVLCRRLPRRLLEEQLHISLHADDDPDHCVTLADRLLGAFARRRGFQASHGRLNRSRAAKDILKAYVDGELVYVEPPPSYQPTPAELSIALMTRSQRGEATTETVGEDAGAKSDGDESWDSIEEEAWDALEDAAAERALSDVDPDDLRSQDSEFDEQEHPFPFFFGRPPHMREHLTRHEAFNWDGNIKSIQHLLDEKAAAARRRARKKNINPQVATAEPDVYTFINRAGEVELRVDDDDGVIEFGGTAQKLTAPAPAKAMSKRQQRRQMKKEMGRKGGFMIPA